MTGSWQERVAALAVPPTAEQAARRAAVAVALHARDAEDEALLLDMLGLDGGAAGLRMSPGESKQVGARFVHGTRRAVAAHLEAGQRLCAACRRCAEVDARKGATPPVR